MSSAMAHAVVASHAPRVRRGWSVRKLTGLAALVAAVGLTVAAPAGAAAPAGLVGAWSFDEPSGATAKDLSGSSNTATLTSSVARAAGKYGQALSFTGAT